MAAQKKPKKIKDQASGGFDIKKYLDKATSISKKAITTATPYAKKVVSGSVSLTKSGFAALSKAWNNAMKPKDKKGGKK